MQELKQVVIPITLFTFGALVLIIAILAIYNYFSNRLAMRSAQTILKDNKELTPEQIRAIFQRSHNSKTRKGIIGIALAIASILCGIIMGSHGYKLAQSSFIGMAMFPGVIGLTYLYLHNKNK